MSTTHAEAKAFVELLKKREVDARELYYAAHKTSVIDRIEANPQLRSELNEADGLVNIDELDQENTDALVEAIAGDARRVCDGMTGTFYMKWKDVEELLEKEKTQE